MASSAAALRARSLACSSAMALTSLLARVRTPVHVLHAEHTFAFVSESVARWTNLNDHVSAEQVAGGHCFMQERPDEAARGVAVQLLSRLDAVSA